jgi:hypothetical protein
MSGDANGRPDGIMPDANCGSDAKVPLSAANSTIERQC